MVFTSPVFLFAFLPLVLVATYALGVRARNAFLTLASYAFYAWWSPWFVTLMLASTVLDWGCGLALTAPGASARRRRAALAVSVAANLGLLGFFKYAGFAQENLNRLLALWGAAPTALWSIVLPVGISFYSFQSMSYTIDLYRGHAARARSFTDFACYVALFPQLVAGPIVRYRELALQLVERPQRGELFERGVLTFAVGFAKKVLLANTLGEVADLCFEAGALTRSLAWLGAAAYAFQIYFDFSGYSDMAIGLGCMLGFRLPINFRSPYRSEGFTDFWRRWHVSLSTWLRDYLYVPLGGNRRGPLLTYRNLLLTMLLGGLWHGAAWSFLAWGALHGLLLAAERARGKQSLFAGLPRAARVAATFAAVCLAWVPFRAPDLAATGSYWASLFAGSERSAEAAVLAARVLRPEYLCALAVAALVVWRGTETEALVERLLARRLEQAGTLALFAVAVVAMFAQAENPFLYFRF